MDNPAKSKGGTGEPVKTFSGEAQELLKAAYRQATQLKHDCVAIEHIAIAMIQNHDSIAKRILDRKGIDLESVRAQLLKLAGKATVGKEASSGGFRPMLSRAASSLISMFSTSEGLPFSLRVKKSLALALQEARDLGQAEAGSEHILLGMLRERDGSVPQLLTSCGVDLDYARKAVVELAKK